VHFLQVVTMDCLDIPSFVELDPPTARGSASDDEAPAIAVFGVTRSPQRAHLNAITAREGLLRLQRRIGRGIRAA